MKLIFENIKNALSNIRYGFLIVLLLFAGNYQQAVEKPSQGKDADSRLTFSYKKVTTISPQYKEFMEEQIDSLLKRTSFNGNIMLAHKGEIIYNKSQGISRFSSGSPFENENNVFQLASVGKQFTAMATLILMEKGLIELNELVKTYIEDFPYENITVQQLLNHTSGLQNYFYIIENHWTQPWLPTHQDMLDLIVKHNLPLNFVPGNRFSYSNTGYAFLAMIIEKVSGESYASFVKHNIFEPAGMTHSFVFEGHTSLEEQARGLNLVYGHERRGRYTREIPVDFVDGITGDKGIYSCTEDLLKWDNAIENNLLISQDTKNMAFERQKTLRGYAFNYGFGYRIRQIDNQQMVYHHGWWRGFRSVYSRFPDNTLLVILNNTTASITGLEEQIWQIIKKAPYPVIEDEQMIISLQNNFSPV